MYFLAAALIGLIAAIPAIMWARHQRSHLLAKGAGWGLIVIASIYVLAAFEKADGFWKLVELMGVGAFGCFYWLANKRPLWVLAWGWALHPVWDIFLHYLGPGAYIMPDWYSIACAVFDIAVAAYLFWRDYQQRHPAAMIRFW